MTLIGVHRLQGEIAAVLDGLGRHLGRKLLEGFLPLQAVVAGVHADAQALFPVAVDGIARQILDGVQSVAPAANEQARVRADQLGTVAFLVHTVGVRHGVGAHMLQQALEEGLDGLLHAAGSGRRVGLGRGGCCGRGLLRFPLFRTAVVLLFRTAVRLLFLGFVLGFLLLGLALRLLFRLDLLAGTGNDAGGDGGNGRLLLLPGAGGGGKCRFGRGRLVRCLIGHLDLCRRCADAQETGAGVADDLDRNAVTVQLELRKRRLDGKLDGLARGDNKFFHGYSSLSSFA